MRKAQAAMEFIMSYGWAVILLLVILASLSYIGIISPGNIFNRCSFAPGLSCNEFNISKTGLTLVIQNNFGQSINITSMQDIAGNCTGPGGLLKNGETAVFTISPCNHGIEESKYKSDLMINYTSSTGKNRSIKGRISGRVE